MNKKILLFISMIAVAAVSIQAQGLYKADGKIIVGQIGFLSQGQRNAYTYNDGTPDMVKRSRQGGVSLTSMQIVPFKANIPLNFYASETFTYLLGGSETFNGVDSGMQNAGGLGMSAVFGVSTFLPQFVDNLHIMVGAGYHIDFSYLEWDYGVYSLGVLDEYMMIDISLAGLAFNVLGEYDLSDNFAVNLGIETSFDFYGLSLGRSELTASNIDSINSGFGFNFAIQAGVSFK